MPDKSGEILRACAEEPSPDTSLDARRSEWAHVRHTVLEICALPQAQRSERLRQLALSQESVDRRILALLQLQSRVPGFLEQTGPIPARELNSDTEASIYSSGAQIGPYKVIRQLGRGGMGQVYLASDVRLLREVAIKVLSRRAEDSSLLHEARMAARLRHDNIADIYDVIEADGRLHIVMERLDGTPLNARLAEAPITTQELVSCIRQILDAVSHAHSKDVIHCDLKPANVFVLPSGQVKVLDFGLARLNSPIATRSVAVAGTPRYLAPERMLGTPATPRTDIFSLGVILADLLADSAQTPASPGNDGSDVARSTVIARLRLVASRAMAANPAERYGCAEDLRRAVAEALQPPSRSLFDRVATPGLRFSATAATLTMAVVASWSYLGQTRAPVERPVVGVEFSGASGDPLAVHLAAALEQITMSGLSPALNAVVVHAASAGSPVSESGVSHLLTGVLRRTDGGAEVALALMAGDGVTLASHVVRTAPGEGASIAAVTLNGAAHVLRQAGIEVGRTTLDEERVRASIDVEPKAFEEYAQAREYMRTPEVAGNTDYAIGLLKNAIEREQGFVLAHASLAEAYWQQYLRTRDDQWTNLARASALEAVRLSPSDPAVRYTLALMYRGMGRVDEALVEVSKAIALQPTNDDMFRLRGRLHADLGRLELALRDLATARSLRPGYWDNHRTTGLVLFEVSRYTEAVEFFRRAAELRPNNASAYQALGTALQAAGDQDQALSTYEKALAIAPNANTYSNVAKLHYDSGRFNRARAAYEESARLQPREPKTFRNLGDTLVRLGSRGSAAEAYRKSIALAERMLEVNPRDSDALSQQAICHAKLGNREDAVRLASRVLGSATLPPATRYRTGVALVLAGRSAEGVSVVKQALAEGFSRTEAALDVDLLGVAAQLGVR